MKTQVIIMILIVAITGGCKNNAKRKTTPQPEAMTDSLPLPAADYYFAGEYTLVGKKASLRDCATGRTLAIAFGEVAHQVEEAYHALEIPEGEPVLGEFHGYLVPADEVETNPAPELVITRLVGLSVERNCLPGHRLTGSYVAYVPNNIKPSERFTFTLNPDYTYTFSIYNAGAGTTREARGAWHLLSENCIRFTGDPLTSFHNDAFINYTAREIIFKNSKRVYHLSR